MVEIRGLESAEQWYLTRGRLDTEKTALGARIALRAIPALGAETPKRLDRLALPAMRASITYSVASAKDSTGLSASAAAAEKRTREAYREVHDVARSNSEQISANGSDAIELLIQSVASIANASNFQLIFTYGIENIADGYPVFARPVMYGAANADAKTMATSGAAEALNRPIWTTRRVPEFLEQDYLAITEFWRKDAESWDFWARWYESILKGEPMDWELQEKVALIDDEFWATGARAVAAEIEKIESEFDLLNKIDTFQKESDALANRLGIGGNNPPVEIEDPGIVREVTIIWDAVQELKEEIEQEEPEKGRIEALIGVLSSGLKAILSFCRRKLELALDVGIKVIVTAGLVHWLKPDLLEALIEAAKRFLSSGAAG